MTESTAAGDMSSSDVNSASGTSRVRFGEYSWVWLGLVGLLILSLLLVPSILTPKNLLAVLPFFGVLALVAVGQCFVIMQRGLDLSIPGTIALTAIVMTRLDLVGTAVPVALLVSLGIAVFIGVINGLVILRLSVSPLIATLATNAILLGAAYMISGGQYLSSSPEFNDIVRAKIFLSIPLVVVLVVLIIAAFSFLLRESVPGRRFVLVGSNPAAAHAAGIRIKAYQFSSYVVCSLLAAIAGLCLTGFTGSATPKLGNAYLLSSVAAVVIGGTPLTGGRGSLIATAAGALLLSQLDQLTAALGAPQSTQLYIAAGVLVLAFAVRQINRDSFRRIRGRPGVGLSST